MPIFVEPDFAGTIYITFISTVVVIYAYTIVVLFINRKTPPFNSAFFALWINRGIIDILFAIAIRVFGSGGVVVSFSWMHFPAPVGCIYLETFQCCRITPPMILRSLSLHFMAVGQVVCWALGNLLVY
jgi:hypothetical protein